MRGQLALAVGQSERVRRLSAGGVVVELGPRRVVAAFDFDGTLTDRDTLVPFLVRAFGRTRVAWTFATLGLHAIAFALGRTSIDAFKVRVLRRLMVGQPVERLRRLGATHARDIRRWLRTDALERIEWHRERGHRLVLVSSTLDLYLVVVASDLGFDDLLCTRLAVEVQPEGVVCFTGLLAGPDCSGAEKLRRLRALVGDLGEVELHAYGDSAGDRELLGAADHAHYRPFRGPKPGPSAR